MILKESIINNWGTALKDIAIEEKKVEAFMEQANALVELLKDRDDFVKILSAKITSNNDAIDKSKIIDETFGKAGFDINIVNAMKLLADASAFNYTRSIFKNLRKQLTELSGAHYGVAWSTMPLAEKDLATLEEKISSILNSNIKLVNKIDDKLIGGVQVVVANKIFDGSVKGQLDELKYKTLEQKIK